MKNTSNNDHRLPLLGNRKSWILLMAVALICSVALAQSEPEKVDGKVVGGYQVNQTVEFGGRIVSSNGSDAMYDTLVDLHSGARLLDYSVYMNSIDHTGGFMDNLSFTNSGYGGDPERMSRLRISKNRWYDFSANYRRNVNFYDYNAFANPYNYGPTVAVPTRPTTINFNDSIHMMNTRRNMGDFNLTIAPQSALRFRLGYSRVLNEGPSYSSFHEGTDVQLFQNFADRQDQYTIGADWRFAPRTNISFDETMVYGNVNTTYSDTNVGNATILGRAVDIGAIWNPYYGQPCTNPSVSATGALTPINCGVYGYYSRSGPVKTVMPTSSISFTSNYFKKLDLNGSFGYTSGESYIRNYMELANAYVTRTNELGFQFSGPTNAKRIAGNADFGFTFHINDAWSISNQTRWLNYRQPSIWDSTEYACFPNTTTGVNVFTPVGIPVGGGSTCAGIPAAGTPQHSNGSGADFDAVFYHRSFNQQTASNTTLLQWDFSKRMNVRAGYRYGRINVTRLNFDSETAIYLAANPAGSTRLAPGTYTSTTDPADSIDADDTVRESAFVFGLQVRPVDAWRINFDYDLARFDAPLTPIWPQRQQKLKLRSNYKLNRWLNVGGAINLLSNKNDAVAQNPDGSNAFPDGYSNPTHSDHSNGYNLNFTVEPNKYVMLDTGFTWNSVASTSGTCLMVSTSGSGAATNYQALTPQGGPIQRCPQVADPFVPGVLGAPIPSILNYDQKVYTIYTNLLLRPVKRVTVTLGMDSSADSGKNDWLRADTRALLRFPVDAVGNVVYAGNTQAGPIVGYANAPNPWQPLGTLYMKWLRPNANVEIELHKNLSFKGGFNYWDYREKGPNGPSAGLLYTVAPRNFTAKAGTLSLRYSF